MQTAITLDLLNLPAGQEADKILRSCVHCGFCLSTCPTYTLLGNELDSPRGRIYLIKQVLEGSHVTNRTQLHLDRCLTCLNCETSCPSGVRYHDLISTGRRLVEEKVGRKFNQRLVRRLIRMLLPYPARTAPLVKLGQWLRPILPAALQRLVPPRQDAGNWPAAAHTRRMLILDGCVQPPMAPRINAATARVLDRLGISLVKAPGSGCCGALSYHLSAHEEARQFMCRNIDAWWPLIENGCEAIVITASGCGVQVKDYAHLLQDDPAYAARAARVSALTRDIAEILVREDLEPLQQPVPHTRRIAFQAPCSLQHGQKLEGIAEQLLRRLGFELNHVSDPQSCCGSAGTYSLLQPELSQQLLHKKLAALEHGDPDVIATANIGCLLHLQTRSRYPVRHWIEILDEDC